MPGCGQRCPAPSTEINLVKRVHGDAGEDLEGSVDVAAPQQMVDALGAGGVGPLGVAGLIGEEVAELNVRQDVAVPVTCDLYGVLSLHVGGRGVIAGDPGREPGAGVGPHGQLRGVQRAQGLIDSVEVPAPVRRCAPCRPPSSRWTACAASRAARR